MLGDVLHLESEQLRGVATSDLLAGWARLFADGGAAARLDPAGTFELSRPVPFLDYFISHSWRTSRWLKLYGLLFYLNEQFAISTYLVVFLSVFAFELLNFEAVPELFTSPELRAQHFVSLDDTPQRVTLLAQLAAACSYVIVVLHGHRLRRRHAFLDICCIDQLDAAKKAAGIVSLGAVLDRSDRMLVLLDDIYMTRMWCIFELAAFAKRCSLAHMVVLPLHMALKKAALATLLLGTAVVVTVVMRLSDQMSLAVEALSITVLTVPLYALLLHASVVGHNTAAAIDGLQSFKLANAECFSEDDRANIIGLISRWFDDSHGEAPDSRALGIHNFERFVQKEVYAKINGGGSARRRRIGWSQYLSVLLAMGFGGSVAFEQMASPEASLYHMVGSLALVALTYAIAAVTGGPLCEAAAIAVRHAQERWGWGAAPAYLFGLPILFVGLNVAFTLPLTLLGHTYSSAVSSARNDTVTGEYYPDDGLDPGWPRRSTKLHIIILLVVIILAMLRQSLGNPLDAVIR